MNAIARQRRLDELTRIERDLLEIGDWSMLDAIAEERRALQLSAPRGARRPERTASRGRRSLLGRRRARVGV